MQPTGYHHSAGPSLGADLILAFSAYLHRTALILFSFLIHHGDKSYIDNFLFYNPAFYLGQA